MPLTEKPGNWSCIVDGKAVVDSGAILDLSCEMPLGDVVRYWGQDYTFRGPLSVRVLVSGDRTCLSVNLSLKGTAEVPCARCLEPALLDISGDFLYFYRPLPECSEGAEPAEGSEEDVVLVDSLETELDVSCQAWELLILTLPEKSLCSENCLGLCPWCGVNMNKVKCSWSSGQADPRFDVLAGLMKRERDHVPGKGGDSDGNSKK